MQVVNKLSGHVGILLHSNVIIPLVYESQHDIDQRYDVRAKFGDYFYAFSSSSL